MQKGKIKPPLGSIQLLDGGRAVAGALKHFSEKELGDSSFAAGIRAKAVLEIFRMQEVELACLQLMKPLMEIEMPLVRVLSSMECKGICLDRRVYNSSKAPLLRRQEEVSLFCMVMPKACSNYTICMMHLKLLSSYLKLAVRTDGTEKCLPLKQRFSIAEGS